jgi:hypothetical protein
MVRTEFLTPTIRSEPRVGNAQINYESEMALFFECMPKYAQKPVDTADIVNGGDTPCPAIGQVKNSNEGVMQLARIGPRRRSEEPSFRLARQCRTLASNWSAPTCPAQNDGD